MKSVNEMYGKSFFGKRYKLAWRAEHVCKAIDSIFKPASVIDVGCAVGDLVKGFIDMGILAYGLEGANCAFEFMMVPTDLVYCKDLRKPFNIGICFDLVTCFEVAEHIEPEFVEQFVSNLIRLSSRILISAAPPGQKGHHHYNCQFKEYWMNLFDEYGYKYIDRITEEVKQQLEPWKHKSGIKAYHQNLMYFEGELPC